MDPAVPAQAPPARPRLRLSEQARSSLAGAAAGCASSLCTCPLDVVKTKLQHQRGSYYAGTADTLRKVLKAEGVRGLYRGLGATLLGYLPTWSIYFSVYSGAKARLLSADGGEHHASATRAHLAAAVLAGACSALATNPLWVVRARLMVQSSPGAGFAYRGLVDAFRTIYRAEGARAFYAGLAPSLFGVLHVAVQFPLYERLKAVWNEQIVAQHGHSSVTQQRLANAGILLASSFSKMIASVATYPHEVVRTRLQTQTHASERRYAGVVHAVRVMHAEEGARGFYRGLTANLIRTVPASAVTIFTYEWLMRHL